jgi:hypothetical protein
MTLRAPAALASALAPYANGEPARKAGSRTARS